MALIHCNNSLPVYRFVDKNNDKYKFTFKSVLCPYHSLTKLCKEKYKSPDCFNEYYSFKVVSDKELMGKIFSERTFKSKNPNVKSDINLRSIVRILFNKEPDTIYIHSPQQYPIEIICFIGGVISLWTGFSVISIYAYGKQYFRRNQNKVELIKTVLGAVNNRKRVLINKMNDKISSLQTKLNKVMKVIKIKKKNKITSGNCVI